MKVKVGFLVQEAQALNSCRASHIILKLLIYSKYYNFKISLLISLELF